MQADPKLRMSENQLRALFEFANDALLFFDLEGRILEANRQACEGLGYRLETLQQMRVADIETPEQAARFAERIATLRSKGHHLYETVYRRRDATTLAVEISACLIDTEKKQLVFAICHDIRQRDRQQSELVEIGKLFSVFMEHLPAGAFIKDDAGRLLFANRYLKGLLGRTQVEGKTTGELLPEEFTARMTADDAAALAEGPVFVQERITDGHGEERSFDIYKFPIVTEAAARLLGGIALETTQRVKTERELADAKSLLQAAFRQTPVPMALVGAPDGIIKNVNQAGIEMLGPENAALVGRSLAEISPAWKEFDGEGNRIPLHELPLSQALRGIVTKDKEIIIQRKDGSRRYAIVNAAPICNSAGKIIAAFTAFPDITERKRVEQALEKRLVVLTRPLDDIETICFEDLFDLAEIQHFQDLFANVWGVAALITRPDGTPITRPSNFTYLCSEFIRKNEKGSRNCKLSDATLGRHNPAGPIIHQCLSAGLCAAGASITVGGRHIASWLIGQVRNEAQSEEKIMEYARAIGADEAAFREAYLNVPVMPQKTFDQIAHSLFALANQLSTTAYQNIQQARFIAERRQAEEALRASEEKFRGIYEASPIGIELFDRNGRLLDANRACCEIFGIPDMTTIEGFKLFEDPNVTAEVKNRLRRGEEVRYETPFDFAKVHALGLYETQKTGIIHLDLLITPLKDAGGTSVIGYLVHIRDITERKQAEAQRHRFEAQIREIQKLESLGILAGGIAHDFNNLLMAILGNADLALFSLSSASPVKHHIEEIVQSSHRAANLCRQMLAYSGKGHFVIRRHDISEIVREMGQMLDVSISKKATLRQVLAEDLPAVEADATQMRQVIMNLITNASEALGDSNGVITITTGVTQCDEQCLAESYLDDRLPAGDYVFLEVSDTGCGIDAATRSKLFDPFFTTKFIGRGLGLPAVLGIVRGHKGAIRVDSEVGRGTTFKIFLPAVAWKPEDMGSKAQASAPLQAGGTILLVDEDA